MPDTDQDLTPQPIGLGDPDAADRQGEIAADDAGASAVTASIGGVQGDDDSETGE